MSDPNRDHFDEPHNLAGSEALLLDIDSLIVGVYHELPDGKGKPSEVHLVMNIAGMPDLPLVMRFKNPRTLDSLISALAVHRRDVWGND